MDNLSREVQLICRACGGDQFEYDDEWGCLSEVPDDAVLKCASCGLITTKGELIADNAETINAAAEDIVKDVTAALQKELNKSLKKALKR